VLAGIEERVLLFRIFKRRNTQMPKDYFVGDVAKTYDSDLEEMFIPAVVDPAVEFLWSLADAGSVLELGVGTGRIALPLSARGLDLHGIELSPDMVAELIKKKGSENIAVTVGDFAETRVEGQFTLAYLVFNTIMNLTTQAEQLRCFRNVAQHLESNGIFVIEAAVPILQQLSFGQTLVAYHVSSSKLDFDEYDVATQGQVSHHFRMRGGRLKDYPLPFRYVWPSELDLMAQLAGMTLVERWGDWDRRAFTSWSVKHVSVWKKAKSSVHD
jgi:SAM-dependent methyltransferase